MLKPLLITVFLLVSFTHSCDDESNPINRTFSKTKKKPSDQNPDAKDPEQGSIPLQILDGSKVVSRDSLGFERYGGARGNRFAVESQVIDISSGELSEGELKSTVDYVVTQIDETKDCRVKARREDKLSFFELDCTKVPDSQKSRFFEMGLTPDDPFIYGASDCSFEDRQIEERGGFRETRSFKVRCETAPGSLFKKAVTEIEAWYHPKSLHPSGLVELRYQNCSEFPCSKQKIIKILEPTSSPWVPQVPNSFDEASCSFDYNEERVSRCEDTSCFDLSAVGFNQDEKICECQSNLNNVPVVYYYLPASLVESGEKSQTTIIDHSSQSDCESALSTDAQCQTCFSN